MQPDLEQKTVSVRKRINPKFTRQGLLSDGLQAIHGRDILMMIFKRKVKEITYIKIK